MHFIFLIFLPFFLAILFFLFKVFESLLPLMFRGAIYVPTKKEKMLEMIKLAEVKKGDKAVDLGSGDGRLVIALAKKGVEAHGYEINPFLFFLSKRNIKKAKVKASVHFANFWKKDLSQFNVVTLYGMNHVMGKLEQKLKKELKPNSKVVSNSFDFPNLKPKKEKDSVYLYILG